MSGNKINKKIFCIGSNLESYNSLNYLIKNGCVIHTLITLPKKEKNNISDYYDMHSFCSKNGINVIDTVDVNSKETINQVKKISPDYLFTLGWSQIFKEEFINCFLEFIIGTHPSKLPYGRGRAPVPWTILEGLNQSAVSFFAVDKGVDTGKLIFKKEFNIPNRAYAMDVYNLVSENLGIGFYEIYNLIYENAEIKLYNQDTKEITYRSKRVITDGIIEFDNKIKIVDRLIRAVSKPYPGAYCYYKDKKIIFWSVDLDEENVFYGTLGQIHKKSKRGILVQFLDGNLWLNEPTDENNKKIDLSFFKIGDKLGYNIQDQIFYLRNKTK